MPQAAQFLHVRIENSRVPQRCLERLFIKLRIMARSRNCADVDHALNPVPLQEFEELLDGPIRMADRKNFELLCLLALGHFEQPSDSAALIAFDSDSSLAMIPG